MIQVASIDNRPLLNYEDALLYCLMLDINGHNDWRLPTFEELKLLAKHSYSDDIDKWAYNWTVEPYNNDSSYIVNLWGGWKISQIYWKQLVIAVRNS